MIVRILTEGQFELDDGSGEQIRQLDDELVAAVRAEDESRYRETLATLVARVREQGRELDDDSLEGSDLMIPPADSTLAEARREFTAEGLIPE